MKTWLPTLMALTLTACAASADESKPQLQRLSETPAQYAARMKWFGEARFGMFIHWGVYSVPAGEFDGNKGYGEWILETVNRSDEKAGRPSRLPVSKYEKFAAGFNPVKFDAREWVRLAKEAGMKYLVITSKHHDGFCLWDSKLTDWDMGRTPFQRDPLKELSEACRAEGVTFCLYHSIMDWHHPDYADRRPWNDLATGQPDMDRYMSFFKGQLREILTGYGPLGVLWFDGEWEGAWNTERGIETYNFIRGLQPGLIVNNRVGRARAGMAGMDKGAGVGDYGTPEQEIPPTGFGPGVYWESCMTMNDHWGYNQHDQHWKSTTQLVRNLIDCASKGGNYLLNVGPTAEGLIPAPSVERLREIGAWTKANGAAIYGTQAGPFRKLPWGRATQKTVGKETLLYLHVFDWPADGKLLVPGLLNQVTAANLLVGGAKLKTKRAGDDVVIEVPKTAPDNISSTVVLKFPGQPRIAEQRVRERKDGSLRLEAVDAELVGKEIRTENMQGRANIGFWSQAEDFARWPATVARGGEFEVSVELAAESESDFEIEIAGSKLSGSSINTKSWQVFASKKLGNVQIPAGDCTIAVKPVAGKWSGMNLRRVVLQRIR